MSNWRKKGIIIFLILTMLITLTSCRKKNKQEETDVNTNIGVEKPDDKEAEQPKGTQSPISGIYVEEEEKLDRRPFAVVFDNQVGARPQAGLIDAEIAYEFLAEGDITRYLGIFLINEPETIGPIRSARPYLIQKALEFDAYFTHVGGSPQAFADIKEKQVADIDAMSRGNDIFWRKNHKKIPHNLYSSYQALKKATERSKYREESKLEGFKFNTEFKELDKGEAAREIRVKYFNHSQPSYTYDSENKDYKRFYNDSEHKDEITEKTLTASNIIIQSVPAKVIDAQLRLEMSTVGQGQAKYITGGKAIDITWKKDGYSGATKYYKEDGEELVFNPGKTWVQVVRNFDGVTID